MIRPVEISEDDVLDKQIDELVTAADAAGYLRGMNEAATIAVDHYKNATFKQAGSCIAIARKILARLRIEKDPE